MTRPQSPLFRAAWLLLLMLMFSTVVPAQELLWEDPDVATEVDGQRRLKIRDLHGTISLRLAPQGEFRYAARTLDNERRKIPVALWLEDGGFVLKSSEGYEKQPVLIELTLPPKLAVVIDISDSIIQVGGLHSDLQVRGTNLDLTLRSTSGTVDLELSQSNVDIEGVANAVTLQGDKIAGRVSRVEGSLQLDVSGSQLTLGEIGSFEGEVMESTVELDGTEEAIELQANESRIGLAGLKNGGRIWLGQSPCKIKQSRGVLDIETDSEVEFHDTDGSIKIVSGHGGSVRGSSSKASLSIETNSAEISLVKMAGAIQIQGDDLKIHTNETSGELHIVTTSSNLTVEMATGPVKLHNDYGDVLVRNTAKALEVVSTAGNVSVSQVSGPVDIRADGEEVYVAWAVLNKDARGFVENRSGNVRIGFPGNARCRLEAETEYGQIESEFPDVTITDDGTRAKGQLGKATAPLIHVKSAGDLIVGGPRRRRDR